MPALGIFTFLLLTEKPRSKPWIRQMEEKYGRLCDESFGILCGCLWLTMTGIGVTIGMFVSWWSSLLVIPFACAAQCLLLYFTISHSRNKKES
jgi:hypothetical protein